MNKGALCCCDQKVEGDNEKSFKERAQEERKELSIKCGNLKKFTKTEIFENLTSREKDLLTQQLESMESYYDILNTRISFHM